jgi:glucose-6-phosphate isomerase, archaeal
MEIYLKNSSGIDMIFDCNKNVLKIEDKVLKPDIRTAEQLSEVAYDKQWVESVNPKKSMYLMFRDVACSKDIEDIHKRNLRYDITVIFPCMMGVEYPKTLGHYHPFVPGEDVSYPEIYEVLSGEAHYVMQKVDSSLNVIDNYVVKAKTGDKIIIPPGYGHFTINPIKDILIMANWTDGTFMSDYKPVEKKHGSTYFEIEKDGVPIFIVNENYGDVKSIPKLRKVKSSNPKLLGLDDENVPMYTLVDKLDTLELMSKPQKYEKIFKKVY